MKPKKRKLKVDFVVSIRGCKKDFGYGPGVIGTQQVVFTDSFWHGFKSPRFLMSVHNCKEKIVDDLIQVHALASPTDAKTKAEVKALGAKESSVRVKLDGMDTAGLVNRPNLISDARRTSF